MNDLIIIGCGGHSKSIIDLINSSREWKIKGLIGKSCEKNKDILGYKVIGDDKDLQKLSKKVNNLVIGIGQIGLPKKRQEIFKKLIKYNFNYPIIKSSFAIVSSNTSIGCGTTIGHGAVVNANVNIGEQTIINSSALIEHDVRIGNFCHISTGAIINGNVKIGDKSFIGSGAIIREGLEIPSNTIISAGKVIMGWPPKTF